MCNFKEKKKKKNEKLKKMKQKNGKINKKELTILNQEYKKALHYK